MKMNRMKMMMFWLLACTVAFLFCCVLLKTSSFHHSSLLVGSDGVSDTKDFGIATTSNLTSGDTSSLTVVPDTFQNFTCSASDSKEVIPPHLSESMQEFLRHRHCRAFQTLLTPSPCEDDLYLLLAIKSTAQSIERRAALRETWGRAGLLHGRRVKLVFLMGRSYDQVHKYNLQPMLEWESRRYGDIMQWDFADIFYNLPQKEVQFLRWFSQSCSNTHFALKGDDDVFVNTGNLLEFLGDHNPDNHLFVGYIHSPEHPMRGGSKYSIPVELYPAEKLYPAFPSGGGYLMSQKTLLGLNVAAQKVKLFPLDDVFLGMCLDQMGIQLTHHKGFLTFGMSQRHPCIYRGIMLVHPMNPVEMRLMWGLINDNSLTC